jgi:aminobenzoyl-glutamate utilization protein B
VGVNYLREHMVPDARVHYAVTNSGGISPNVVQARAEVLYLVRAPVNSQASELYERVKNVARGAALMTGCELDIVFDKACSNYMPNRVLNEVMYANMQALQGPAYTPGEEQTARRMWDSITEDDIDNAGKNLGAVLRNPTPLFSGVAPFDPAKTEITYGSTDVGDVSWVTPTAQCWGACYAYGTPFHSWQMVAQGKLSMAHKGMVHAAKIIAATAADLYTQPEALARAKEELLDARRGQPYVCPIPAEVVPAFMRK